MGYSCVRRLGNEIKEYEDFIFNFIGETKGQFYRSEGYKSSNFYTNQ